MKVFRNLILGFFLGIFVILMLTVLPTLRYENNIGSSFLRNDFHKRIKLKLTSKIDELSNLISVDKIVGVVYNKSKFHQMEKDIYHIVNYSKTNIIEAKKKYTAILDKMTTKEELKKKTNDVTQSNLSTKDTDAANEHLDKYTKAIRQARKKLLQRCPSLNIETMSKVGVEPGSLDIVITTANFTTSNTNEKAKFYIKYPVDMETNKCEPRATTSQFESKKWENVSFRCDHTSSKPCCVQNPSTDYVNGNWGHCVSASKANDNCRCKDCFDYRFRRNSLLFNEIRFQLRSLENNGVFVKSSKHPDGIIGKIFIVYNDGTGNPAPTFLQPDHPNVIAVPHKILWNASGSMEGYPSANRNAIAAQLHHIPGLGQYVMYLEDDMFLNIPLRFGKGHNKYITDDGRIVSYLTNQWIMSHPQPEHGWPGAMWSSLRALEKIFGKRNKLSKSRVKGMENITIGNRAAEKEHGPRFWNKCAMEELWRLWPEEFAATVKRTLNNKKDFQTITHLGMFMEDLGLGTNIVKEGSICHEVHTSSDTKYTKFVGGICSTWKKKNIDWLQVQGDGISDEYMESKRSARGHIRWAWQAIMDAMWPKQSMFENSPFGDEYYERLNMLEEGQKLCKL